MRIVRTILLGIVAALLAIAALALLRPVSAPPPAWTTFDDPSRLLTIRRPATTQIIDRTETALDRVIDSVNLENVRLVDFMEYLGKEAGVNVVADWNALDGVGISKDTRVTVKLKRVSLRIMLRTVLKDLTPLNLDGLGYRASENVIRISQRDVLTAETFARVHDVRDLLTQQWIESAIDAKRDLTAQIPLSLPTTTELADTLARLIQESVDPPSWREAGGASGHIQHFNGRLVIITTWENHRQIDDLLEQLRATIKKPQ